MFTDTELFGNILANNIWSYYVLFLLQILVTISIESKGKLFKDGPDGVTNIGLLTICLVPVKLYMHSTSMPFLLPLQAILVPYCCLFRVISNHTLNVYIGSFSKKIHALISRSLKKLRV